MLHRMRGGKTKPYVIRAFVRPIRGLNEATQHEIIGAAIYYEAHEREEWIKALRKDEIARVARLDVIPPVGRVGRIGPTTDLAAVVPDIISRCAYLEEAATGITSLDKGRFREAMELAGRRVSQGRMLDPKRARAMAKKSREVTPPGTYAILSSPDYAEWRDIWGSRWRDSRYESGEAAYNSMPADVRALLGSEHMARKVFGPRHPGRGFGRPPARGKRKR